MEDSNSDPKESMFEMHLGENGGIFLAHNFEDIERFIQKEIDFWKVLKPNFYQGTRFSDPLYPLVRKLEELLLIANTHDSEKATTIASEIVELYAVKEYPHSTSVAGHSIINYAKTNPAGVDVYARFLIAQSDQLIASPATPEGWRAFLRAFELRYKTAPDSDNQTAIYTSAMEDALSKFYADHERLVETLNQVQKRSAEADEACSTIVIRHEGNLRESKDKHLNLTEDHLAEMDRIRRTYREEMALRAPGAYWSSKQTHHRKWATVWGVITGLILIAAVLLLWNNAKDFLEPTPISSIQAQAINSSEQQDTLIGKAVADHSPVMKEALRQDAWRIGVFALMAVFGFWAVRLVVRMFLSHLHLHTDASERMVMLQTYLALMEADKLADKDDRTLILQALFRPASDGIVKDEAAPPSIGEWLTRTGKA